MSFLWDLVKTILGALALVVVMWALAYALHGFRRLGDAARRAATHRQRLANAQEIAGRPSWWRRVVIGPSGLRGLILGPAWIGATLIVARLGRLTDGTVDDHEGGSGPLFLVVLATFAGGWMIASSVFARSEVRQACRVLLPRAAASFSRASNTMTAGAVGVSSGLSLVAFASVVVITWQPDRSARVVERNNTPTESTTELSGVIRGALACRVESGTIRVSGKSVDLRARTDCGAQLYGGFHVNGMVETGTYTEINVETQSGLLFLTSPAGYFGPKTVRFEFEQMDENAVHGFVEGTLQSGSRELEVRLTF